MPYFARRLAFVNIGAMRRHLFTRLLIFAVVLFAASCSTAEWRVSEGSVWNTTFKITYKSDRDLTDSIFAVMREVELSLSPFNAQSRISQINRNENLRVDSLILQVFEISQEVCRKSGGRFDPTVAPIVNLWGFGYEKRAKSLPAREEIDSALSLVGLLDCHIDSAFRMVKKSPLTTFNFSAVTKGFGCDRVGEMLRRSGVDNFMVEIGGELALAGSNPRGSRWHIQIDAPVYDPGASHTALVTVAVTDCGVASSGNYRNFKADSLGNRRGHTIDALTGMPFQGNVLAATVIAQDCATADALATACMASPSGEAAKIIEAFPDASALLVVAKGDSVAMRPVGDFPLP